MGWSWIHRNIKHNISLRRRIEEDKSIILGRTQHTACLILITHSPSISNIILVVILIITLTDKICSIYYCAMNDQQKGHYWCFEVGTEYTIAHLFHKYIALITLWYSIIVVLSKQRFISIWVRRTLICLCCYLYKQLCACRFYVVYCSPILCLCMHHKRLLQNWLGQKWPTKLSSCFRLYTLFLCCNYWCHDFFPQIYPIECR